MPKKLSEYICPTFCKMQESKYQIEEKNNRFLDVPKVCNALNNENEKMS